MAMTHNHIPSLCIILREGEEEVQNRAEIMILYFYILILVLTEVLCFAEN